MELKKGYKQTEIGIIPNEWNIKPFVDVSSMKGRIGWQGLNKEEFNNKTSDPFLITGMNFKNGEIRWDEVYHVPEDRYEIAKDIQLKDDDVLMTKDGTIGKLLYVSKIPYPFKATLNSHLLLFRPKYKSYNSKFLYYQLSSIYFKQFIEENKSGTTFFGISQESVGKYPVILPPLQEQESIAQVLTDTDQLIQNLKTLIGKKKAIKQGAMQELLSGKKRLKSFVGQWKTKKLGEIAEIKGGGTPSTNIPEFWNGNINWFTPTEVGKSKYIGGSKRKITQAGFENCSSSLFPKGTILLTTRAGIGDLAILTKEACTNQGFQSFIVRKKTDNEFTYYLLNTLKDQFTSKASGSTFQEISPNNLKSIEVLIPELREQKAIAQILSDMDLEIEALETQLQKIENLKQGMMQELLTGKTRLVKPVSQATKKENKIISMAAEPDTLYKKR